MAFTFNELDVYFFKARKAIAKRNYSVALDDIKVIKDALRYTKASKRTEQLRVETHLIFVALKNALYATDDDFDVEFRKTVLGALKGEPYVPVRRPANSGVRGMGNVVHSYTPTSRSRLPDSR